MGAFGFTFDSASSNGALAAQAKTPWGNVSIQSLANITGFGSQGSPPTPRATDTGVTQTEARPTALAWIKLHAKWLAIGAIAALAAWWFLLRKKG